MHLSSSSSQEVEQSKAKGQDLKAEEVEPKKTASKAASVQSGKRKASALAGYSSGTLGVNSPSLSDLEQQKTKRPKKITVKKPKPTKPIEHTAESSPRESASKETAIVLADAPINDPLPIVSPQDPQAAITPALSAEPTEKLPAVAADDFDDLIGFTLDELDEPEIFAAIDPVSEIRNIQAVSKQASAAVIGLPGVQERLNRLFHEVCQPEADLLNNTQKLRDAMAAVEADLPPEAMNALLEVCHLDSKKTEVTEAKARIAQRENQQADQKLLDRLVAEAKRLKGCFDKEASTVKVAKTSLNLLEAKYKSLEQELAEVSDQMADVKANLTVSTAALATRKSEISEAVSQAKTQSAKLIPVPGNAKEDEHIVDNIQAIMAKAAMALSALGARLPGSGL